MLYTWISLVSIYIWHVDLEGLVDDKDANKFVQLKGVEVYLWWFELVMKGVIAHGVTLGAYNTNKHLKFIQTKIIHSLDRQRFILVDDCPISTNLVKYNKRLRMLDIFNFVCHHTIHFSVPHNEYLDTSKPCPVEWSPRLSNIILYIKWWHTSNQCKHGARLDTENSI